VIHAYALEPELVATWGRRSEYRFIHDKFGLGTPRAMLELPSFTKWKRDVYRAANDLELSQEDMLRLAELFRVFSEHKCRRADAVYDGVLTWLENGEREYDRKPFAGILATQSPRVHEAVLLGDDLKPTDARWARSPGATARRTPEGLATALTAMLINCRTLHLVDPHFGPENARHWRVLEALLDVLASNGVTPDLVRVHCSAKSTLEFFEGEASKMAARLPSGITVEFRRWTQRNGGDRLHNRYVLTDLGGVALGVGLDVGAEGETDDLLLLPQEQYVRRWAQYAEEDGSFDVGDMPVSIQGQRRARSGRESNVVR
jgi:hypothetical protein